MHEVLGLQNTHLNQSKILNDLCAINNARDKRQHVGTNFRTLLALAVTCTLSIEICRNYYNQGKYIKNIYTSGMKPME